MPFVLKGQNIDVKVWVPLHEVESGALTQLRNLTTLPVVRHVSVMPDVHWGKGCTVGSVVAMQDAVSPAAVGVDIGCGMSAVKTSIRAEHLPDAWNQTIYDAIVERTPVGNNEKGAHQNPVHHVAKHDLFDEFKDLTADVEDTRLWAMRQCGTLGGGNHFIEICLDTDGQVWIMLHSGSRYIGKTLAEKHMTIARQLGHNGGLVDPDLAYFLAGTPEMKAYRHDLYWAQRYAFLNRELLMALVKLAVMDSFPEVEFEDEISCHHNYVAEEVHYGEKLFVTRKGAIRAQKGDMGIIPGSMGSRSYIVRGLGNEESLCSASHGAGRKLSRGAAKRTFTVESLVEATSGVACRKDEGVIDEHPDSYKDIDTVLEQQSDLVEVVAQLKQITCVKG